MTTAHETAHMPTSEPLDNEQVTSELGGLTLQKAYELGVYAGIYGTTLDHVREKLGINEPEPPLD